MAETPPNIPPADLLQDPLAARIQALVEEVIQGRDVFLVEIDLRGQKGSRVVDVYLDSEAVLGVDLLAEISRELAFLLDAEDVIKGRYHLNVSSPGANRPLKDPRQYRKHIGRALKVRLQSETGGDAPTSVTGTLTDVLADGLLLTTKNDSVHVPFASIDEAVVQLPW